jgi:hypothetical protein
MNDKCPVCDRLLPPDGDCYGCAADKAWVEITALRDRLARAEAALDARIAFEADMDNSGTSHDDLCRSTDLEADWCNKLFAYKAGKDQHAI